MEHIGYKAHCQQPHIGHVCWSCAWINWYMPLCKVTCTYLSTCLYPPLLQVQPYWDQVGVSKIFVLGVVSTTKLQEHFTLLNYNILVCVLLYTLIQCNVNPIVYAWCCVTVKLIYTSYISITTFINYYIYFTIIHHHINYSQCHNSTVCAYVCMRVHLELTAFHHNYLHRADENISSFSVIQDTFGAITIIVTRGQAISGVSADIGTHLPCQRCLMAEYIHCTLYTYTVHSIHTCM